MPLIFYHSPGSSSMAVHIALQEIGVPFQARVLSFSRREHQAASFLAINPDGKVPTLVVDGDVLTEVAGILFYLARRFPEARLLPVRDLMQEAKAIAWMSYAASTLHPARGLPLAAAIERFRIAEQLLSDRDWALADYSIVDMHLFRIFWRFGTYSGLDRKILPGLWAHHARMLSRPAVKRTLAIESALGYDLPP